MSNQLTAVGEAEELITAGNLSEARALLENLLQEHPDNVEVLTDLGVIAYHEKNFGLAKAFFKRALRITPDNEDAAVNLVAASVESHQYADALVGGLMFYAAGGESAEILARIEGVMHDLLQRLLAGQLPLHYMPRRKEIPELRNALARAEGKLDKMQLSLAQSLLARFDLDAASALECMRPLLPQNEDLPSLVRIYLAQLYADNNEIVEANYLLLASKHATSQRTTLQQIARQIEMRVNSQPHLVAARYRRLLIVFSGESEHASYLSATLTALLQHMPSCRLDIVAAGGRQNLPVCDVNRLTVRREPDDTATYDLVLFCSRTSDLFVRFGPVLEQRARTVIRLPETGRIQHPYFHFLQITQLFGHKGNHPPLPVAEGDWPFIPAMPLRLSSVPEAGVQAAENGRDEAADA